MSEKNLPEWARDVLTTLPALMSVEDAAKAAALSSKTIRRAVKAGTLEIARVGDRVIVPRLSLVAFLVANATPPSRGSSAASAAPIR